MSLCWHWFYRQRSPTYCDRGFTKDPKYRETNNISCEKTKSAIIEGINGILNGISIILIFGATNMA